MMNGPIMEDVIKQGDKVRFTQGPFSEIQEFLMRFQVKNAASFIKNSR